jgi:hypothetical protein
MREALTAAQIYPQHVLASAFAHPDRYFLIGVAAD